MQRRPAELMVIPPPIEHAILKSVWHGIQRQPDDRSKVQYVYKRLLDVQRATAEWRESWNKGGM